MEAMAGFFWHRRRGILFEYCYKPSERVKYILTRKPRYEQGIRLRLFQPVRGELPKEVVEAHQARSDVHQACVEAHQARAEADRACAEADQARGEADRARDEVDRRRSRRALIEAYQACADADRAYAEADQACAEARQACAEADRAYSEADRAYNEAIARHLSEITELHSMECPNCPWDGNTIFPEQSCFKKTLYTLR